MWLLAMNSLHMTLSGLRVQTDDLSGESLKLAQQTCKQVETDPLKAAPPALVSYSYFPISEGEVDLSEVFWPFLAWETKPTALCSPVYQENMKPFQ